LRSRAKETMAD